MLYHEFLLIVQIGEDIINLLLLSETDVQTDYLIVNDHRVKEISNTRGTVNSEKPSSLDTHC